MSFLGAGLIGEAPRSFGADRMFPVASGDQRFPSAFRVSYPAGSASPAVARGGAPSGGAQRYFRLAGGPVDTLRLAYHVRFPAGFDFVKGGKLPGLYGGTVTGGKRIPDGTDGFSTRYMWRRQGAGEVYAYLPGSVGYGTSLGRGSWFFVPGRWTHLEQEIRLNTPGSPDGCITVLVDGRQVYHHAGLTFRTTADLKIDGVFFSTFFGGGDTGWVTPTDQYADFAAFEVFS